MKGARTAMVALEMCTDEELAELQEEFSAHEAKRSGSAPAGR